MADMRVFINVNPRGLEIHLKELSAFLESAGYLVTQTDDDTPTPAALAALDETALAITIVAYDYGDVQAVGELSRLEHLFEAAQAKAIPHAVYVLDPEFAVGSEQIDLAHLGALLKFRQRISNPTYFTTPEDLKRKVFIDISLRQRGSMLAEAQAQPEPSAASAGPDKRPLRLVSRATQGIFALFAIIGSIAAVVALIGLLPEPERNRVLYTVGILPASPTPTHTPTLTPTHTPTATLTPTASPTPMEGQPATEGETLVVIADFPGEPEVADELATALDGAGLRAVRVRHPLRSDAEARQVSELYDAAIAVWKDGDTYLVHLRKDAQETLQLEQHRWPSAPAEYARAFVIGQAAFLAGDFEAAAQSFADAEVVLDYAQAATWGAENLLLLEAKAHLANDEYSAAATVLNRAAVIAPQSAQVFSLRGTALYNMGDSDDRSDPMYVQAHADFNRALDLNPDLLNALIGRGRFNTFVNRFDDAIRDFSRAIALDASSVEAYTGRAFTYYWMGSYTNAVGDAEQAIRLSETAGNRESAANAYVALGDATLEIARNDFLRTLGGFEPDLDAAQRLFDAEIRRTLDFYGQALSLDPDNERALTRRADVLDSELNDEAGARADRERLREIAQSRNSDDAVDPSQYALDTEILIENVFVHSAVRAHLWSFEGRAGAAVGATSLISLFPRAHLVTLMLIAPDSTILTTSTGVGHLPLVVLPTTGEYRLIMLISEAGDYLPYRVTLRYMSRDVSATPPAPVQYERGSSGITLDLPEPGRIVVTTVEAGSSAEAAGIQAGDQLVDVAGTSDLYLAEPYLPALLLRAPGEIIPLVIERAGVLHRVSIEAARGPFSAIEILPTLTPSFTPRPTLPPSPTLAPTVTSTPSPTPAPAQIVYGETKPGWLQAGVPSSYQFAGAAGDAIVIHLESEEFDPFLRLLDFQDNVLAEDDDSGMELNSRLSATLPAEGLYHVEVSSFDSNAGGKFTLSLEQLAAPGDLSYGQVVQGQIQGGSPQSYRFSGQAGERVQIQVDSSEFDAMLTLFLVNSDSPLASNDDYTGLNPYLEVLLPEDGVYRIEVSTYSGGAGAFWLMLDQATQ
ncbi:MAG: pre-peptidase C-terminal domain-containing protein [Chloroflexi bacterium]|nr:pre-peptidase C-terminal domain-containing protein [Chloroflexota bacterium]